jgi:hypothetical protein
VPGFSFSRILNLLSLALINAMEALLLFVDFIEKTCKFNRHSIDDPERMDMP